MEWDKQHTERRKYFHGRKIGSIIQQVEKSVTKFQKNINYDKCITIYYMNK